jgi:hypothetical protein
VHASINFKWESGKLEVAMSVDTQPRAVNALATLEDQIERLQKRTKRMLVCFTSVAILLAVALGSLGFLSWKKSRAIDKTLEDAAFHDFEVTTAAHWDLVSPQVNIIQFLHRGYSVNFDSVNYTQEGLVLSGTIGNPTQLWISSLALKFTARPHLHTLRDKWKALTWGRWLRFWADDWNIGSGQTTVGFLNPGGTAPFSVTIPNVKQTSDGVQIAVQFSGERYSYSK